MPIYQTEGPGMLPRPNVSKCEMKVNLKEDKMEIILMDIACILLLIVMIVLPNVKGK
jgi:hypothetical protein